MTQRVPYRNPNIRAVGSDDDDDGQRSARGVSYYASLEPLRKCDPNQLRADISKEDGGQPFSFQISKKIMAIIQDICATRFLPCTNPGEYGRMAVTLMTTEVIGRRDDIPQRFKNDIKMYNNTLREVQRRAAEDNALSLMAKASDHIRNKYSAVPDLGAKEWLRLERRLAVIYRGELRDFAVAQWATRADVAKARQHANDHRERLEAEMTESRSWGFEFDDEDPGGLDE